MIGQNHGFAAAVEAGTAPRSAYAARPDGWSDSADRLATAAASAPPDRTVLLVEISEEMRFPLPVVIGSTCSTPSSTPGTWPPRSRRRGWCPPGAAFAPVLSSSGDHWEMALALLGRDPHGRLAG